MLCTDQHSWSTERIVHAFRGQWGVEELFRRAKKGGVAPWGPSFQRADGSLRLHTFATVIGLMLVSLARIGLGTEASARAMMATLAGISATLVRTTTGGRGRRPTVMLPPELTAEQRRAARVFVEEGQPVDGQRLSTIVRACLREMLWCRLESESCTIAFGYDYYVYWAGIAPSAKTLDVVQQRGKLFLERVERP